MRGIRTTSTDGFSFIELVVSTAVILVLASAALPIARVSMRRQNEAELRHNLAEVRAAIDAFKVLADQGRLSSLEVNLQDSDGYPTSLEQLVDGVSAANDVTGKKYKFLRRIPIDPVTGQADWGLRAYRDLPKATTWGGGTVYDIYSKAEGKGLDGVPYKDW